MKTAPHPTVVQAKRAGLFVGGALAAVVLAGAFVAFYYLVFHASLQVMRLSICTAATVIAFGLLLRASRKAKAAGRTTTMVRVWVTVVCFMILFAAFGVTLETGIGHQEVRLLNLSGTAVYAKIMKLGHGAPLPEQERDVKAPLLRRITGNAHLLGDECYVSRIPPEGEWRLDIPMDGPGYTFAVIIEGSVRNHTNPDFFAMYDRAALLKLATIEQVDNKLRLVSRDNATSTTGPRPATE